jgi:hypothetical protein
VIDPIYSFRKGVGWVPGNGKYILTQDDCRARWFKAGEFWYPEICGGWHIVEYTMALLAGDIIPYRRGFIKVITSSTCYTYRDDTWYDDGVIPSGTWRGVARQP